MCQGGQTFWIESSIQVAIVVEIRLHALACDGLWGCKFYNVPLSLGTCRWSGEGFQHCRCESTGTMWITECNCSRCDACHHNFGSFLLPSWSSSLIWVESSLAKVGETRFVGHRPVCSPWCRCCRRARWCPLLHAGSFGTLHDCSSRIWILRLVESSIHIPFWSLFVAHLLGFLSNKSQDIDGAKERRHLCLDSQVVLPRVRQPRTRLRRE